MDLETKIQTVSKPEKLNSVIKTEILDEFYIEGEKFPINLKKEGMPCFLHKVELEADSKSLLSYCESEAKLSGDPEFKIKEETQDADSSKESQPSISGDPKHNKRFICIFCNKAYNYLSHLKKHIRTHSGDKPYTCEICCKNFRCKGTLKVHFLTHTGSKPFKCQVCEKEFQTSSNLKKHKLVHTDEKPYTCDICHRKYRYITQMKNHRMQHLGEKKYRCSFCDDKFSYLVSLKSHLLEHTGEVPPFKCDICKRRFKMSHHLKRHRETHVGAPFICLKCNSEFLQLRELQKHSADCRNTACENLNHRLS